MKVKVAETAGFCFGVQRAIDKVYELIGKSEKPIFTLGPITWIWRRNEESRFLRWHAADGRDLPQKIFHRCRHKK